MAKIRTLNKALQAKAEAELNETHERLQTDLDAFKAWLQKTPHLLPRQNDQFLVAFLRGCKYSLERAKEKLDGFYTIRGAIPEFFTNRQVTDELINFVKTGAVLPLPQVADPAGARVILYRMNYDSEKIPLTNIFKWTGMFQDILMLEDDNLIVSGSSYVMDLKNSSLTHFVSFTPPFVKKVVAVWEKGNPFRIKSGNFINMHKFSVKFTNLFKSAFSRKLQSRVSVPKLIYFEI